MKIKGEIPKYNEKDEQELLTHPWQMSLAFYELFCSISGTHRVNTFPPRHGYSWDTLNAKQLLIIQSMCKYLHPIVVCW